MSALTNLSPAQAKEIYEEVNGRSAPQGRRCLSLEAWLKNKRRQAMASILISNYDRAVKYGIPHAKALILAHEDCRQRFNEEGGNNDHMTIDRAWHIVQSVVVNKTHKMARCGCCHSSILIDSYGLAFKSNCPVCACTEKSKTQRSGNRIQQPAQQQASEPAVSNGDELLGQVSEDSRRLLKAILDDYLAGESDYPVWVSAKGAVISVDEFNSHGIATLKVLEELRRKNWLYIDPENKNKLTVMAEKEKDGQRVNAYIITKMIATAIGFKD